MFEGHGDIVKHREAEAARILESRRDRVLLAHVAMDGPRRPELSALRGGVRAEEGTVADLTVATRSCFTARARGVWAVALRRGARSREWSGGSHGAPGEVRCVEGRFLVPSQGRECWVISIEAFFAFQ